ncbi:MAG: Lactose transport system permease protein LacF [Fimbriimonadaceae bacterium]|nr:Lactose transport system permease protein LacF [Fimbriimonadaceae bacterium]
MKRGYAFVAPAVLHLLVFALVPIAYAFGLSFYKWDILKEKRPFVGAQNYLDAIGEPAFWNAMWNSTRYALVSVPLGMAVALAVAILVAQKLPGMPVFRTLFYIPAISSGVAISMLWIYVYLPETGMINTMLASIGLGGKTDFLNDPAWAMWALVFMSIWTGLGPRMVLYLSGLLAIPPSLYEAGAIDGATGWKAFWGITLPMLAPTSLFVLVTSTISAFQVFTPVYMMTKGGPLDTTDVIGYHIYSEAWQRFHVGFASAKSFLLLVVIALASWLQFRIMRRQMEGYEA